MTRLGPRARKYIRARIDDHVDAVEATPLQNTIHDADDGAPETLHHLATAAEAAYYAADCERDRDRDDPVRRGASEARNAAKCALTDYIDELVAKACVDVIRTVDEWEWPDDEQATQSKHEAREWLQEHTEAAERAGVLEELELAGRPGDQS